MPYYARKTGSKYCVYKKDGGTKVGCTAGNKSSLKRYLGALHANANEGVSIWEQMEQDFANNIKCPNCGKHVSACECGTDTWPNQKGYEGPSRGPF
jgi:hypothetical protein